MSRKKPELAPPPDKPPVFRTVGADVYKKALDAAIANTPPGYNPDTDGPVELPDGREYFCWTSPSAQRAVILRERELMLARYSTEERAIVAICQKGRSPMTEADVETCLAQARATGALRYYVGIVRKDETSDYSVDFPDIIGVITAGKTLDEARAMAEEALAFHVEGMLEDGETIPEPSTLEAIMADPENTDGMPIWVALRT